MEERAVKEFIVHKVLIIDENHISIDGVKRLKYEEIDLGGITNFMTEVCDKCYFKNYFCGGIIPCSPMMREDDKQGLWVEDKDYK